MVGVHRLEGFYWVARTGGYARAARAFPHPITQPAVHQQVKKLEAELGIELFERVGKDALLLTPAGKRLYDFIEPFYARLPSVARSLRADDYSGELRIAAPSMYLHHLLPAWLKRLSDAHPDLAVVTEETHWSNCEALLRGDIDLLVDYLPETPDGVASMQVAVLHPFLVLPEEHAFAGREHVAPEELADETFIGYPPGHLCDLQQAGLEKLEVVPPHTLTASSAQAILGFVAAGLGYSLLGGLGDDGPRHEGVRTYPIERPRMEYPVWAAWRLDAPENPMLDAVLETAPRP